MLGIAIAWSSKDAYMESETQTEPLALVARAAPTVVAALIVGAIGSGIITWHISDSNSLRIKKLEEFAHKGERCTFRDCQRIERLLYELQKELKSHESQAAHREAAERFRVLRQKVEKFEDHLHENNNP